MRHKQSEKIAFIQSSWHKDIVDRCREGFSNKFAELDIAMDVEYFAVPGAFELPLKCKQLLATGDYAMVIAAGFVVDGGIYRHEFVAQSVISGLMQVQLELGLPVLSVVLTPKEFQENKEEDQTFFLEHMVIKGREAADVAASLLQPQASSHKPQDKLSKVS